MSTEQHTLADMPFWMLVLVSMAGLSGEMLRASRGNLTLGQILLRVVLRFSASALLGVASMLLSMALWGDQLIAGGLGIVVGVIGADVAGGLYARWLEKRVGLEPVRPDREV
ncbi:phage holin family protein [Azotobacter beijerinckii]|uniref:Bacteriophage holin Hol, superfamily III n=1 Tax=Azotobacter beijerinckii TaxID=170623 RepID=A0A1I4EW71_9GAMM|nr:phage holin family protein [Azotobacter beijerinckii]SFB48533.1 Bacteriophage holin Hol, superfamily III [Azotobacter beijerinckii]SFL09952.1 Bacteriophage holin Hol, superfamily III [Azotobacter beijerinckii]